jgi:hypothetical protein
MMWFMPFLRRRIAGAYETLLKNAAMMAAPALADGGRDRG